MEDNLRGEHSRTSWAINSMGSLNNSKMWRVQYNNQYDILEHTEPVGAENLRSIRGNNWTVRGTQWLWMCRCVCRVLAAWNRISRKLRDRVCKPLGTEFPFVADSWLTRHDFSTIAWRRWWANEADKRRVSLASGFPSSDFLLRNESLAFTHTSYPSFQSIAAY